MVHATATVFGSAMGPCQSGARP